MKPLAKGLCPGVQGRRLDFHATLQFTFNHRRQRVKLEWYFMGNALCLFPSEAS
jgi:hypothetical protein